MPQTALLPITESAPARQPDPVVGSPVDVRGLRVMIVDDQESNRRLLGMMLSMAGYTNLVYAKDGADALRNLPSTNPDVMILDIMMPEMDGIEVCKRVRRDPAWEGLPIVVQTALDGLEARTEAFQAGATDFVTKPVHNFELLARLRLHLENRSYLRSLRGYHDRISAELRSARKMQATLLPSPEAIQAIEREMAAQISSLYEPCSELGGDFWGVVRSGPNKIGIYAVDFSGHGMTAALNTFRIHALIEDSIEHFDAPSALLRTLNERLVGLLSDGGFATMFYGILDLEKNAITFSGAAAPNLLVCNDAQELVELDGSGTALGIAKEAQYEDRCVAFPPGSLFFHCSDALTDAVAADGTPLDSEFLRHVVRGIPADASAEEFLACVIEKAGTKVPWPLADDLTAIAVRRTS